MAAFCCSTNRFAQLSRAAAKSAAAKLRQLRALPISVDASSRQLICVRCPMRTVSAGVSYCGRPLLRQLDREPAVDGCGCPCKEKAQSPQEHCPVDGRYQPAQRIGDQCTCKWCQAH